MEFEFATATRIVFGAGSLKQVGPLAADLGRRVLLVVGRTSDRVAPLLRILASHRLDVVTFSVTDEPTIEMVSRGVELACAEACDVIVGFGGGSVIDTGKAIAILLPNPGPPLDFLEVIGRGQPLTQPSFPYIAIPTTAGTGAEVTRNAVLGSPDHRVKVSLRSPLMLPRLAVVDPELTVDLPPELTAATGLDALTQVIEPFVSRHANPLTDALCREAMGRVARSLRRACEDGHDITAREDMAVASLFGGLALANAKLGAVHGFAGPFGGMFSAPHGATCAALLPHAMSVNVAALRIRRPESKVLDRFNEVARLLTGDRQATADDGVQWVRQLCDDLAIPSLSSYGVTKSDFPTLIEKATHSSSMKGNPIRLLESELTQILRDAL